MKTILEQEMMVVSQDICYKYVWSHSDNIGPYYKFIAGFGKVYPDFFIAI